MKTLHPLQNLAINRKRGLAFGICSICSASEHVILAAMDRAAAYNTYLLIESTANQVNQFGGYTGMRPKDCRDFVFNLASRAHFPRRRIILGGDHLGPLVWKNEKAASAMKKAEELVREYALAGFTKLHLDTSMRLGDDPPDGRPDDAVIAERAAGLCRVAENAFEEAASLSARNGQNQGEGPACLVYVVGSEVPIPGGSDEAEETVRVTGAADFRNTVETFGKAFEAAGLNDAWRRVIAVVVQPGVEFGDEYIRQYNRDEARALCQALKDYPDMVFEGHSTDYQTPECLKRMVEDGIAILKVGPALTFALREALFALSHMENELFRRGMELSRFMETLEEAMLKNPDNWKKHYRGDEDKLRLCRKYSFSDRCRYYLPEPEVRASIGRLIKNLSGLRIPFRL